MRTGLKRPLGIELNRNCCTHKKTKTIEKEIRSRGNDQNKTEGKLESEGKEEM